MKDSGNRQYISYINYSTSALPSAIANPSAKEDSLASVIRNRTIIWDPRDTFDESREKEIKKW